MLPAGTYALFTIPTATTWTFVVNRDPTDAGIFGYDQKNDVLRVDVPSEAGPARERMIFLFEDTTEDSTKLVLDWAGKRVVVPIKVDTKKLVQKSIDATMANAWRPPFNVGRYILDSENDPQRALAMFEKSIAIQPSWWNEWWAAQALAKLGKFADARSHAEQARTLGKGDNIYEQNFSAQVTKSLAEWEKK